MSQEQAFAEVSGSSIQAAGSPEHALLAEKILGATSEEQLSVAEAALSYLDGEKSSFVGSVLSGQAQERGHDGVGRA